MKHSLSFVSLLALCLLTSCTTSPSSNPPTSAQSEAGAAKGGSTDALNKSQPDTSAEAGAGVSPSAQSEGSAAQAGARKDPPPKQDIACRKGADLRVLEIEEVRGGCWVMYSNKGIKKRTAWSKNGNAHCEKVRDQIRSTLEKAGYKCLWQES